MRTEENLQLQSCVLESNLRTLVHLDVETLMVSFVDCNGVSLSWVGEGGVVSLVYRVIALFITDVDVRGNDLPDGWHRKSDTFSHILYLTMFVFFEYEALKV